MKKIIIMLMLSAPVFSNELDYYGLNSTQINAMDNCCTTQKQVDKAISDYHQKIAKKLAKNNPNQAIGIIKANTQKIRIIQGEKVQGKHWLQPNDVKPFDRLIFLPKPQGEIK